MPFRELNTPIAGGFMAEQLAYFGRSESGLVLVWCGALVLAVGISHLQSELLEEFRPRQRTISVQRGVVVGPEHERVAVLAKSAEIDHSRSPSTRHSPLEDPSQEATRRLANATYVSLSRLCNENRRRFRPGEQTTSYTTRGKRGGSRCHMRVSGQLVQ